MYEQKAFPANNCILKNSTTNLERLKKAATNITCFSLLMQHKQIRRSRKKMTRLINFIKNSFSGGQRGIPSFLLRCVCFGLLSRKEGDANGVKFADGFHKKTDKQMHKYQAPKVWWFRFAFIAKLLNWIRQIESLKLKIKTFKTLTWQLIVSVPGWEVEDGLGRSEWSGFESSTSESQPVLIGIELSNLRWNKPWA